MVNIISALCHNYYNHNYYYVGTYETNSKVHLGEWASENFQENIFLKK